jgi:transcriptional regulator with XRE-family HTH domain
MDKEQLYQAIGRNIRAAREQSRNKISQEKLAKHLGLSRASIVNIEAGRQHAPLHLLWQIAEALDTELVRLIPTKQDLAATDRPIRLTDEMFRQIEKSMVGDPDAQRQLAGVISKLKFSIEPEPMNKDNV